MEAEREAGTLRRCSKDDEEEPRPLIVHVRHKWVDEVMNSPPNDEEQRADGYIHGTNRKDCRGRSKGRCLCEPHQTLVEGRTSGLTCRSKDGDDDML
eukprot:5328468-Prymnesium_polylepis.2